MYRKLRANEKIDNLLLEELQSNLRYYAFQLPVWLLVQRLNLVVGLRQSNELIRKVCLEDVTEKTYPGCRLLWLNQIRRNFDLCKRKIVKY